MNASERAKGLEMTTKIAATVNLFKAQFPDAKADLKPWRNDPDTRKLIDPDSIDIGFHFPGYSRRFQSNSMLVQIRFHQDSSDNKERLIGIEITGFSHQGQTWRLSTIEYWQFVGSTRPVEDARQKLKFFCRQVFELFNAQSN